MKQSLNPRDSGKYIAENTKYVQIQHKEIPKAALRLKEVMGRNKYSIKKWKEWPLHPKAMNDDTLHWILTVDTLNFSFWLPRNEPQFQVEYKGKTYEDYEALCACVNRAVEEGILITTASYNKEISLETVNQVFRSSNGTTLPMLKQRWENLRQVGLVLCEKFNGNFANVIKEAGEDVEKLIELVTTNFSCFNDVGCFEGQPVQFQKRVQILIADIWACFEATGHGRFRNIHHLTMFPDYRVPQALLSLGVVTYTDEFMKRVQSEKLLPHGEREEMEIRGCSIHAIELLREHLNKSLMGVENEEPILNSVLIDFYLWDFATENASDLGSFPEHRTRSIYY